MISELENKIKMLKAVQFTLNTNNDIVTSDSELFQSVSILDEYLSRLANNEYLQRAGFFGSQNFQSSPEQELKKHLLQVVLSVNSLAAMAENVEIMTETVSIKYNLDKINSYNLLDKAQKIFDFAVLNFTSLEHFGISERVLSEMNLSIKRYEDFLTGETKNNFDSQGEEIISLNEICCFLEDNLDRKIENMQYKYPRFFSEYYNARELQLPERSELNSDYPKYMPINYLLIGMS